MKRLLLLAALLWAAANVPVYAFQATPEPEADILLKLAHVEGKILRINLANLQKERTVVQLTNLKGDNFFTKVIRKHNGFFSKINLNELPKGRYVLSVKQSDQLISQVIVIEDNGVKLSAISR